MCTQLFWNIFKRYYLLFEVQTRSIKVFQSQRLRNEWQVTSKVISIYIFFKSVCDSLETEKLKLQYFHTTTTNTKLEAALSGLAEPKNLIDNYFAWLLTKAFCYLVEKIFRAVKHNHLMKLLKRILPTSHNFGNKQHFFSDKVWSRQWKLCKSGP